MAPAPTTTTRKGFSWSIGQTTVPEDGLMECGMMTYMAVELSGVDLRVLEKKCVETRLTALDMVEVAGSGHYGPAFSVVEILVSLYYGYMRIRPDEPRWPERDRFVMS